MDVDRAGFVPGMTVALKVIDSDAGDATSSARLPREARNVAALNHPHICTIHEVGEAGGTAFIAMEYVSGRSLRDRADEGRLPVGEFVRLGNIEGGVGSERPA